MYGYVLHVVSCTSDTAEAKFHGSKNRCLLITLIVAVIAVGVLIAIIVREALSSCFLEF